MTGGNGATKRFAVGVSTSEISGASEDDAYEMRLGIAYNRIIWDIEERDNRDRGKVPS